MNGNNFKIKSRTTGAKDKKKRKRRAIEKHLFENYDADTFMAKENKITKEIANKLNMEVSEVKEAIAHPDFSPARHIKSVGPLDDVQLHSRTAGARDKKKRKQRVGAGTLVSGVDPKKLGSDPFNEFEVNEVIDRQTSGAHYLRDKPVDKWDKYDKSNFESMRKKNG